MDLDPVDFANLYNETKKTTTKPPQPTGGLQSGQSTGPTPVVDPAPVDDDHVHPGDPAIPQMASNGTLIAMLQQQQLDQKRMMERQAEHQDKLMKLIENSNKVIQNNSIPAATATTSTTITAGRVSVLAPRNTENLALAGISLPPMLRIEGDLSTIDMSKMKSKLKSGRNWSGEAVATVMEPWPQQYLDRILTTPVAHSKLSLSQYYCGSITKIFAELEPSLRGSRVENQVKFLMYLSKQALVSPWEDILSLSDSFYCALEQNTVSWESWPTIQTWWVQSVDALRSRSILNPTKKFKPNQANNESGDGNGEQKSNKVYGIPIGWFTRNSVCIKFNTGICDKPSTHKTLHGDHTLKHVCAGCLKLDKGEDNTHPAKDCQFKSQFFV
jgi:hypothetical protein